VGSFQSSAGGYRTVGGSLRRSLPSRDHGVDDKVIGWREATEHALYGDGGFYRRTAGPAEHFRTSVHGSALFAEAVLVLARSTGVATVVDVGSGRGELLLALRALDPTVALVAVELADRPADLPGDIGWLDALPGDLDALVIGNEWLDNVPVDAAVLTEQGWRLLLVEPATGREQPGAAVDGAGLEWLERWWPAGDVGDRAEIGLPRDHAWAAAVGSLSRGVAVAVDYHHQRSDRPRSGSLAGFRGGTLVDPVPDGSCDITSHVALDSCAVAGQAAGADWTVLTDQRSAVRALIGAPQPPSYDLAVREPAAYLAALSRVSHAADLTRRDGLGGFGWLVQGVGVPRSVRLGDPGQCAAARPAGAPE
jgi:SAM-dependent MidA family methyltransferase